MVAIGVISLIVTQSATKRKYILVEDLKLWYQAILSRYESTVDANNAIDTKMGIVLAAAIAIISLGAPGGNITVVKVISLVGFIVAISLCIWGLRLRLSHTQVSTTEEQPDYYFKKSADFVWQLISDLEGALKKQVAANIKKSKLYEVALYTFVGSGILYLAGDHVDILVHLI